MSALDPILVAAMSSAYQEASSILQPLLFSAEQQLLEYSRQLSLDPDYDVSTLRNQVAAKRVELWTQAFAEFHLAMAPLVASEIASAVTGYLRANNRTSLITGTLAAPNGPVVQTGGSSGIIVYP